MKKTLYNDQFFTGVPGDIIFFAASLVEQEDFNNSRELNLALGSPDDGFSLYWDMSDEDERAEALRTIRKLTEGLRNLLSVVERENAK